MTTAREIAARYPGYHYGSGKELEAQIEAYAEEKCRVAREENERLRAMATTELYEAKECNIALSRENAELKAALVEAAIPLEVLYGDDKRKPIREIGTELRVAIEQGVEAVRAALNRPAAVMGEGRGEGVSVTTVREFKCPYCGLITRNKWTLRNLHLGCPGCGRGGSKEPEKLVYVAKEEPTNEQ